MKKYLPFLLLSACTQTTLPPPVMISAPIVNQFAGSGVSDPNFKLPEGNSCAATIARFKATIKNDLDTGHTTQTVFERMNDDLRPADSACSSRNDGQAIGIVRSVRGKYGYPAG